MSQPPPSQLSPAMDPEETRADRRRMVERDLRGRGVSDPRVLEAMAVVPRELFVAPVLVHQAYGDHPLPIGCGQTISQPYMVAEMTARLALEGTERVLEVGTGSGYSGAILALLAAEVVTMERHAQLLAEAEERWQRLGLHNIRGVVGDGTLGWREDAPYDAMVVTAGAPRVPNALLEQLHPGRGRLVIPVGDRGIQYLDVVHRHSDGAFSIERGFPCVFVPLLGREGWHERQWQW